MEVEELIRIFPSFSEARIGKLQSTFLEWECLDTEPKEWRTFRIHYENKREFQLKARKTKSISLELDHPLLLQYHQPTCSLQLVSEVTDKDCFLRQLTAATNVIFQGWRQALDYCFMPPEKFIERSFGILMVAPKPYADVVVEKAEACGVRLLPGKLGKPTAPQAKALLMDEMYVIADNFRLEEMIK